MRLIILNARDRFTPADLTILDRHHAVFYESQKNKLEDIRELWGGDEFVLGVQPDYVDGVWDGLPWETLQKMKGLRGLSLSTTAYEWAPYRELGKQGIPVTNVPGKSTDAVGEYYVFMMVALLRRLPSVFAENWKWHYEPELLGTNAKGLAAGVIGLGKIGRKIADLCQGYGMEVSYWSRKQKDCPYAYREIDDILRTADVVFVTTIADASTKLLIDVRRIDLMKKTAVFLSPVSDMVYDKKYLLAKVADGALGGFGFESETEYPGTYKGNVFPAPEIGYYTRETLANESRIMTESMISLLNGEAVNAVNL